MEARCGVSPVWPWCAMPGRFQAKLGGDACQQRVAVVVVLQQPRGAPNSPNRHSRRSPLAVTRRRLQPLQKSREYGAMMPMRPRWSGWPNSRAAGVGRARAFVPAGSQQLLDHHVGAQVMALEIGFVVAGAHQFDEAHAEGALAQVVHPLRRSHHHSGAQHRALSLMAGRPSACAKARPCSISGNRSCPVMVAKRSRCRLSMLVQRRQPGAVPAAAAAAACHWW